MQFWFHILVMVEVFYILSAGLNLLAGRGGLLSLCHAAFMGIGAYAAALAAIELHVPFLAAMFIALGCGIVAGFAVAIFVTTFRGDAFVVATLTFQVVVLGILSNCDSLTRGPRGLSGIPQPVLLGHAISTPFHYGIVGLALCFFVAAFVRMVSNSPFGRCLLAVREDDVLCVTQGRNPLNVKVLVFGITSGLASLAGAFYAFYMSYIDPSCFSLMESVFVVSIVIIGGAGSLWGPMLGAVLLVTLPEVLRFVGMPSAIAANMRQILYGLALVACMLWRPQGLIGEYAFGREAKSK